MTGTPEIAGTSLADLGVRPSQRLRPPHYLLLTRDKLVDLGSVDLDADDPEEDDGTFEVTVIDGFDVFTPGDWDDDAVWDNWAGEWVVAPEWTQWVEMTAEGSTRYDLRPSGEGAA